MSKEKEEPYIYTLKAILDQNEIYDSGDCSMIRQHARKKTDQEVKYVALEDYRKLERKYDKAVLELISNGLRLEMTMKEYNKKRAAYAKEVLNSIRDKQTHCEKES